MLRPLFVSVARGVTMSNDCFSEQTNVTQNDRRPLEASGPPSRREFLRRLHGGAALVSGAAILPQLASSSSAASAAPGAPSEESQPPMARASEAFRIRQQAARLELQQPPAHPTNGDDDLYSNRIGSYSKGLPHNELGEVDLKAYRSLLNALE